MRITGLVLQPYENALIDGSTRSGYFIRIRDEKGREGWGDVTPLPSWSRETLSDAVGQLQQRQKTLISIEWTADNYLTELKNLALLPSASFGLEAALLSILAPLPDHQVAVSALLKGSPAAILEQAEQRHQEGYTSAKLKVSHLSFDAAKALIEQLKEHFRLRIDVNRAWSTADSLRFFDQFPLNTFDYVEEPFQNPHDLAQFPHPLAVDESFPTDLSLEQLDSFPTLTALIYKPTLQGGLLGCQPLAAWARKRQISVVLSSSFESELGLAHVASIAYRLPLSAPVGIGTYDHLAPTSRHGLLRFAHSTVHIPARLTLH